MPHRLIATLFASYLVAFIDRGLISVAAAPIRHDLDLSDAQLGLLIGPAFVAFFCLCAIPMGWLADRTSRRRLIALGLLFWSVMTGCCALAGSFWSLFAARLGVGLGEACLVPAGVSLIAAETSDEHVAKALGVFLMGAAVGNGVALLAGGRLLEWITAAIGSSPTYDSVAPWRILFFTASLAGLPMAAAVMTLSEPARVGTAPGRLPISPRESLKQALTNLRQSAAAYGYLSAATACVVVLAQVPTAWMPLYFVRTFGLSPGMSATLLGLIVLGTAPTGQALGGILIDKLRAVGVLAAPHFVQALCTLLALPAAAVFCTSEHLEYAATAFAAYNFLVFAATPAGLTGWRILTPESSMGLTIALLTAGVTFMAIGFGPPIVGGVSDFVFGTESALGRALLVVVVAAAILGISSALLGRCSFTKAVVFTKAADRVNFAL